MKNTVVPQKEEESKAYLPDCNRSPIPSSQSPWPNQSHKRPRFTDIEARADTYGLSTKRQKLLAQGKGVKSPGNSARNVSQALNLSTEESYPRQTYPSTEEARAMLGRAEDSAGAARTVKLARGVPGSPKPVRQPPRGLRRLSSDRSDQHIPGRTDGRINFGGTQLLESVGITEILQEDDRPTFIVDGNEQYNLKSDGLGVIYANPALKRTPGLFERIQSPSYDIAHMLNPTADSFTAFRAWVIGERADHAEAEDQPRTCVFGGFEWAYSIIRKRLRVFRGRSVPDSHTESVAIHRPSVQLYQASPASTYTPQLDASSPGYFGPNALSTRAATPGALEALVHTHGSSEHNTDGSDGIPVSPLANGDIGIGELLENRLAPSSEQRTLPAPNNAEGFDSLYTSHYSETGFFDWTRLPISPSLPAHVHFARSLDWGSTSLGPIDEWSADLRAMCNLIMASPHPAAMYWGPDHVAIYNEAYILLAGKKHPELMGKRYQDAWVEIWDAISDVFVSAMTNAQATMRDDDCLFLHRNGYLEETYFSWSIIPLIGEDGNVVGLYNPAFEKTRRKVAERRMLTLREVGEKTAAARKVSEFWGLLLEGLEYNEFDAPLVVVYSLQDESLDNESASGMGADTVSASSSQASRRLCHFQGALGLSAGHPAAPPLINLKTSKEGFAPYFRQAMSTNKPVVLREDDGTLDARLLQNIDWRGFGDPSRIVVVSPIHPTTGDSTLGFLIMGTNPRRPYDEDYDLFVQLLGRQLATSVASVVLYEEEIRKGERAAKMAAQDRIELSAQLAQRTQEAIESENKFTRMAELAPVGMFMGDSNGKIIFTNDAWYDIANYPRGQPVENDWINYIMEEDKEKCRKIWDTVVNELTPIRVEFRFKHPYRDEFGNTGETWVLASSFPEKTEDGRLKGIFGSVTDISTQKFAEGIQKKRMEEAIELKRQQENFVGKSSLSALCTCETQPQFPPWFKATLSVDSLSATCRPFLTEGLQTLHLMKCGIRYRLSFSVLTKSPQP